MTIDTSKLKRYKPGYVHSNDGPGYLSMLARDDGEYVRLEDVKAISSALEQALTQQRGAEPVAWRFVTENHRHGPQRGHWRDVKDAGMPPQSEDLADGVTVEFAYTTPQPSADAVRELVLLSRGLAKRTFNRSTAEMYIHFADELEYLLSAASGEKGVDDTKRLDWIARQGGYEFDFGILNDQPGDGDWFVHGMGGSGQGATFRDAIDAAIKEEAGGQDANTDILDTLAFKTENGDAGRGSVTYIALVASGEADHQQNAAQGGGEK